jgi:hypothetical protein
MTCFYCVEEPHLEVTETAITVYHQETLAFELGAVPQWDFRVVFLGEGLGIVCEGRRMHMDI